MNLVKKMTISSDMALKNIQMLIELSVMTVIYSWPTN